MKVIFFLSLKRFHMNSNIAGEGNECVSEDGNEMPEGLLFDDEIDDSIGGQWVLGVVCHAIADHVLFNEVDGFIDHVIGKAHLDGVLAGGLNRPVHGGQVAADDGDLRIHLEGDREDLADFQETVDWLSVATLVCASFHLTHGSLDHLGNVLYG